ncbi:MAG TPA: DUF935 family protein, partial [Armatimonadota bacterium]|nr:DUF935 family protein [Armatimonadota bacterium]
MPNFFDRASETLRRLLRLDQTQAQNQIPGYGRPAPGPHPELGWGGASVWTGLAIDEFNPDLQGKGALAKAEEMRRTCGQIRAVEKVITLPISGTKWFIEEPEKAGSAEKEAAELLRENLFGGMEQSWDQLIREACLAIYFGFRVPEIVWEEREGLLAIRKVAGRNPRLIERWLYHPNGDLAGYLYSGSRPVGQGLESWGAASAPSARIPIPIEKTLHFVYDQQEDNPQG